LRSITPQEGRNSYIDGINLLDGNINFWAYAITGVKSHLDTARSRFNQVRKPSLWAEYGIASSASEQNQFVRDKDWDDLDAECERRMDTREDPRHLALLTLTRLWICAYRGNAPARAQVFKERLQDILRPMDTTECLYSQWEKRNILKANLLLEAEIALKRAKEKKRAETA
jgi:hypothetical protein